jgi:hypothetical protein
LNYTKKKFLIQYSFFEDKIYKLDKSSIISQKGPERIFRKEKNIILSSIIIGMAIELFLEVLNVGIFGKVNSIKDKYKIVQ